jgi:type III secretion protein U
MKDESEQKSLPASEKKLRDARRKAQVSRSQDFVTAVTLLMTVGYVLFFQRRIEGEIGQLLDAIASAANRPFAEVAGPTIELAVRTLLTAIAPLVVVIAVGSVTAGMTATLGPVFSFEPIKPKLDRIDPSSGLQRIFAMRNIVEFGKSLAKLAIITTAFAAVLRGSIGSLFEAPACGTSCLGPMVVETLRPLALTAVICFLAIGLIDLLVQRRLFLHEMRMTKTEQKRERKDLEGDPLLRGARKRIHRQFASAGSRTGLRHAVVVVVSESETVGLRYVIGDTPIPLLVCKSRGSAGLEMIQEARRRGIPVIANPVLARQLAARHAVGDGIKSDLFTAVAEVLVAAGVS